MKYIMAQPAVPRFEWEVQVAIYGLLKAGIKHEDIVVLFSKHEKSVVDKIQQLDVNVHVYEDERYDFEYIPSLKPYLMYRYLSEDKSREKETYFFMDSDVIVKEPIKELGDKETWYGSDCNGYLNYDYIIQCTNGKKILEDMCYIVGVSVDEIKFINKDCIGAQYIMVQPSANYFHKVYHDSIELWKYVKDLDTNLQKWTVEMWSTLWNMIVFNVQPKATNYLDFTWATDSSDLWDKRVIFHNAGVTGDMEDMFFKGKYTSKDPFGENFDYVNDAKASKEYTNIITQTNDWLQSKK